MEQLEAFSLKPLEQQLEQLLAWEKKDQLPWPEWEKRILQHQQLLPERQKRLLPA